MTISPRGHHTRVCPWHGGSQAGWPLIELKFRGAMPPRGWTAPANHLALGRAGGSWSSSWWWEDIAAILTRPHPARTTAPHVSAYGSVGAGWAGVLGVYPRSWPRTTRNPTGLFALCQEPQTPRQHTLSLRLRAHRRSRMQEEKEALSAGVSCCELNMFY